MKRGARHIGQSSVALPAAAASLQVRLVSVRVTTACRGVSLTLLKARSAIVEGRLASRMMRMALLEATRASPKVRPAYLEMSRVSVQMPRPPSRSDAFRSWSETRHTSSEARRTSSETRRTSSETRRTWSEARRTSSEALLSLNTPDEIPIDTHRTLQSA